MPKPKTRAKKPGPVVVDVSSSSTEDEFEMVEEEALSDPEWEKLIPEKVKKYAGAKAKSKSKKQKKLKAVFKPVLKPQILKISVV